MEQRKAEAEVAAIEAKIIRENAAAAAQTARDNEESQARITAMTAAATTTTDSNARNDTEEPVGEIPREALFISNQFPGLPQGEIAKIFLNKF